MATTKEILQRYTLDPKKITEITKNNQEEANKRWNIDYPKQAEQMRQEKRNQIEEYEKIDGVMSYGQRKAAMDEVEFEIKKLKDPAAASPKVKKKIDFLKENTKID